MSGPKAPGQVRHPLAWTTSGRGSRRFLSRSLNWVFPVSIDTYKAEIARRACRAGAVIVNDVWGIQKDPGMADAVAEAGVHVVMMHNRLEADGDVDILSDIDRFFDTSMILADRAGIPRGKTDP